MERGKRVLEGYCRGRVRQWKGTNLGGADRSGVGNGIRVGWTAVVTDSGEDGRRVRLLLVLVVDDTLGPVAVAEVTTPVEADLRWV